MLTYKKALRKAVKKPFRGIFFGFNRHFGGTKGCPNDFFKDAVCLCDICRNLVCKDCWDRPYEGEILKSHCHLYLNKSMIGKPISEKESGIEQTSKEK